MSSINTASMLKLKTNRISQACLSSSAGQAVCSRPGGHGSVEFYDYFSSLPSCCCLLTTVHSAAPLGSCGAGSHMHGLRCTHWSCPCVLHTQHGRLCCLGGLIQDQAAHAGVQLWCGSPASLLIAALKYRMERIATAFVEVLRIWTHN